ncbi:DNA double-strand break repair helicase HerA [Sulfuracidifex metallicus]|uniref:DUF853 family protein n=1 Tax=Sulfuracidifex metallicus DSM 6482 = JCM 9184 TaxID=523847 RepID=A0A6A9QME7_SULME|nr:DNA double-strand break repair helicase HerA [Sulfuracidifex metallicus]MUN29329.1 DUF853 family protein [Sulfuracidifex metallicus DSM 6482 = JCM 9184]
MDIGFIIGEATPQEAYMITLGNIRLGTYVVIEYDDIKALGLITWLTRGSPLLDGQVNDIEMVQDMTKNKERIPHYIKATIKVLCDLNQNGRLPTLPPYPGTVVRLATRDELNAIFSSGELRIGTLVGTDVPVKISINSLSRHLAILAATGSGKSNTIAVLSERIAELGGSVLIFDYHGEYSDSDIRNLNVLEPKLNPLELTPREFATLLEIRPNAFKQYRVLRRAFSETVKEFRDFLTKGEIDLVNANSNFFSKLEEKIENNEDEKKETKDEVITKVEEFQDIYSGIVDIIAPDIGERLKSEAVNVVNLSPMEPESMDALAAHYLRKILDSRKAVKRGGSGIPFPVIAVIEEAHIFLSKDNDTLTKGWASKIAREGRKFGVSLFIVSQRPKGLDDTILSQMTNKIILRIVEPNDKKYVLESSDNLSEDLAEHLSSLDVGEAIVIGKIVGIPAIIKVDKFSGRLAGADPDLIKEWKEQISERELKSKFASFGE